MRVALGTIEVNDDFRRMLNAVRNWPGFATRTDVRNWAEVAMLESLGRYKCEAAHMEIPGDPELRPVFPT